MNKKLAILLAVAIIVSIFSGCSKKNEVVVYTAVEQVYCEEIFKKFEDDTGIKVKAVYDTEANKTTGLVNRIIAEKDKPLCDVFWNNEFIQTMALQDKDLLDTYKPQNAEDIPDIYKDREGYWTAMGGRARVILVNTQLLSEDEYPDSIFDFASDEYKGESLAMAYPAFGTTKTQTAAMYAQLGEAAGKTLYQKIKDKGVQIVDGNSVTKDMVAAGQVAAAYTDTDDAREALKDNASVKIIYPDQGDGGIGTLITPATVALIKNAPDKENAKKLIDYIVSRETESFLIEKGFFDTSVRGGENSIKGMNLSLRDIYSMLDTASKDMEEIFSR